MEITEHQRYGIKLSKIFCLKFADDVAIVAESRLELQEMIDCLAKYIIRNKLEINTTKSQIMIFRNGGQKRKDEKWTYNGVELAIVNSYKYLGFTFTTFNVMSEHVKQ
uniref:Reverse transcriptase domain-containing protein n=1 Tax=Strigamia maritima TaxID=126957 RepID=T1IMJ4_STRMM